MEISLSLILKGEEHITKFKNYSVKSLSNALIQLSNEVIVENLIFFISVDNNEKTIIKDIFNDNFKNLSKKLIFDNEVSKLENISYIDITNIQQIHLRESLKNKSNIFLFLYSDIIYTKNSLLNSYKYINQKKFSAICSFALSLNINEKFTVLLEKIHNDEDYPDFFLENRNELISNFHKKFEYGKSVNFKSNFLYVSKKNGILVKSQHMHPIMINLNKINLNTRIMSLDEDIYEFFNNVDEVYIEKNLRKILIFSCDFEHIKRNQYDISKINKFDKKDIKILNLLSLKRSISKKNNINIFYNNYLYFSKSNNLKVKTIDKFLNCIILKKSDFMINKLNHNILNDDLGFNLKFKALSKSIVYDNFFYNNKSLRYFWNFIKKKILYKKINNFEENRILEVWQIIFSNLKFIKKIRLLFQL